MADILSWRRGWKNYSFHEWTINFGFLGIGNLVLVDFLRIFGRLWIRVSNVDFFRIFGRLYLRTSNVDFEIIFGRIYLRT